MNHKKEIHVGYFPIMEIKKPNTMTNKDEIENVFVQKLIEELPNYGIDTSKWEYDYGDCCYGGAIEFISRCIIGYKAAQQKQQSNVPAPPNETQSTENENY